jgi:hypothetical protein
VLDVAGAVEVEVHRVGALAGQVLDRPDHVARRGKGAHRLGRPRVKVSRNLAGRIPIIEIIFIIRNNNLRMSYTSTIIRPMQVQDRYRLVPSPAQAPMQAFGRARAVFKDCRSLEALR